MSGRDRSVVRSRETKGLPIEVPGEHRPRPRGWSRSHPGSHRFGPLRGGASALFDRGGKSPSDRPRRRPGWHHSPRQNSDTRHSSTNRPGTASPTGKEAAATGCESRQGPHDQRRESALVESPCQNTSETTAIGREGSARSTTWAFRWISSRERPERITLLPETSLTTSWPWNR